MKTRSRNIVIILLAILVVVALATVSAVLIVGHDRKSGGSATHQQSAVSEDGRTVISSGSTFSDTLGDLPEPTIEGFYQQKVNWRECTDDDLKQMEGSQQSSDGYECGALYAPLDWDQLDGDVIALALAIHRAPQPEGALFYNPGGPGGPATSILPYIASQGLSMDLADRFDIVALDPRGVGQSTPVICLTDKERDETAAMSDDPADQSDSTQEPTPQEIVEDLKAESAKLAAGCKEHSGSLAEHVDTISAAKDFDMARAALGQDKLTYLGYSYGTYLGATYAELFPDKVGRMVLDGALDPSLSVDEVERLQMQGFEDALANWIKVCSASSDCPVGSSVDEGLETLNAFFDQLEEKPLETQDPNRPLTSSLAFSAVIGLLYDTQLHDALTQGLDMAIKQDDGSTMLALADLLMERNADGTYQNNSMEAISVINSLDYSPVGDIEQWAAAAEKMKAELPFMGRFAGYSSAALEGWPIESTRERGPIHAEGTPEIVVVGTTHDPATPYVMSQALADQLSKGVLVSWDGWNHTAYSRDGSRCVRDAVDGFFLNGTVPQDGLQCTD